MVQGSARGRVPSARRPGRRHPRAVASPVPSCEEAGSAARFELGAGVAAERRGVGDGAVASRAMKCTAVGPGNRGIEMKRPIGDRRQRGNRRAARTVERRQERTLGGGAGHGHRVIERRQQIAHARVVGANLDGEHALRRCWQHLVRRQDCGDVAGEAEPLQSSDREDRRVGVASVAPLAASASGSRVGSTKAACARARPLASAPKAVSIWVRRSAAAWLAPRSAAEAVRSALLVKAPSAPCPAAWAAAERAWNLEKLSASVPYSPLPLMASPSGAVTLPVTSAGTTGTSVLVKGTWNRRPPEILVGSDSLNAWAISAGVCPVSAARPGSMSLTFWRARA